MGVSFSIAGEGRLDWGDRRSQRKSAPIQRRDRSNSPAASPRPNQNPSSPSAIPSSRRPQGLAPPIRASAARRARSRSGGHADLGFLPLGGDGALGDAGAVGLHQRHTQLPQQGAGAPPRRQGARQHPHALQKREGIIAV